MDARLDAARVLGIELGDAHVIRGAGGVVTDDVIRSLAVSLGRETGERPAWSARTFENLEEGVRAGMRRIRESPFIPRRDGHEPGGADRCYAPPGSSTRSQNSWMRNSAGSGVVSDP
jgi:carbonic anhydrase